MKIGLTGPIGSGKTTIAKELQERLAGCIILPMAKPLKDYAKLMGWDGRKDKRGRRLLQLLGTECGRKCISDDIWVNKWAQEAQGHPYVICDDARFENEVDVLDIVFRLPIRYDDCNGLVDRLVKDVRYTFGWVHKSEQGVKPRSTVVDVPHGLSINATTQFIMSNL